MKVLHINTSQEGGAALCAIRIHNALRKQGIESKMLFAEGERMPDGVQGEIAKLDWVAELRKIGLLNKLRYILMKRTCYTNIEKRYRELKRLCNQDLLLHLPYSNYTNLKNHPLIQWADVIHLHWVSDFVDYPSFFKAVKKPIVWTLHDKYPAVGVQHYCSQFSPVPAEITEIDKKCREVKRRSVSESSNLNIVAISNEMKDICQNSNVLKQLPCTIIHNGVDIDIFQPRKVKRGDVLSRYIANGEHLITEDTRLFIFSSYGIWDKNKGLKRIIDALEKIDCKSKALIVVGENCEMKEPIASFPIVCTGLIKDQKELSELYTLSNYFILASYEETFAQTPLEAMACGTPVISTPCSGASDLIRPFNGILCKGFGPDDLSEGILSALKMKYNSRLIRQHIIDNYNYTFIAKQYIELYRRLDNMR